MKKIGLYYGIVLVLCAMLASCGGQQVVTPEPSIAAGVYKKDKNVMFVFVPQKQGITNVAIIGDFNQWATPGYPLTLTNGIWKVVLMLDYGVYQYKYVVNFSEMLADPAAEAYTTDGAGGKNSIVEISAE